MKVTLVAVLLACTTCTAAQVCKRGDANCDGVIDNFDIDAFVVAILDPHAVAAPPDYLAVVQPAAESCWALRACWLDTNRDALANNFDIDPFVDCVLGNRLISADGCGLPRGQVLTRSNPLTGRNFRMYIPADFNAAFDPVIISLHGTGGDGALEMGPNADLSGFPDCGDPSWPALAEDRAAYRPFAVICPDLYFNGDQASGPCNLLIDEQNILSFLDLLVQYREVAPGTWRITGYSSGASAAITVAMRHHERFIQAVARYTSLDDPATLDYTYDTIPACLDPATECTWRPAQGGFWEERARWATTCGHNGPSWRDDVALRSLSVHIINNQLEPYYVSITNQTIAQLASLSPPFTNISHSVFPSSGGSAFQCNLPLGSHEEARRAAADAIARW